MEENLKHRCILNIDLEIHPLAKSGECDGHIVSKDKFKEYGIKSKAIYKLDGENLHFLLIKLKELLEQFK